MDVNLNSNTGIPSSRGPISNIIPRSLSNISINPLVLVIFSIVIIAYFVLFASLGTPNGDDNGSKGLLFMEILLWGIFILLVFLNGAAYFLNLDITAYLQNIFSRTADLDVVIESEQDKRKRRKQNKFHKQGGFSRKGPIPELRLTKQVFHLPGNKYTFEDSKAICKAYGGKLASYKQMKGALEQGADWCSYGWSKDQMAYFPTQFEKWQNLQKIKGHKHDCGRPGINGGYIKNPNVRFGVNCYGYKPKMSEREAELMESSSPYPRTQKEIEFDKRVNHWRNKIPQILVAPFNQNNWSVL